MLLSLIPDKQTARSCLKAPEVSLQLAGNLHAVNPVGWPSGADGGNSESSASALWGNEGFVFDVS